MKDMKEMSRVMSLEERLEQIPQHCKKTPEKSIREIIPLERRMADVRGRDPDKYEKASRDVVPLWERRRPAGHGWFLDPSALVDMLHLSAEMPLDKMFSGEELDKVMQAMSISGSEGPMPTYLDAVFMMTDNVEGPDEDRRTRFGRSAVDDMTDDQYVVFLSIWQSLLDEAQGRGRDDEKTTGQPGFLPVSSSFPASDMPVPQLYQAAAECCDDPDQKDHLYEMCEHFDPVIDLLNESGDGTYFIWHRQPVTDTSYLDMASMVDAVTYAWKKKWINESMNFDYIYDLLITPFLVFRNGETDKDGSEDPSGKEA